MTSINFPAYTFVAEKGLWMVKTTTSQKKNSEHSSDVVMVIYGDKGKSEELPLVNEQPHPKYQPGQTDEFQVTYS